MKPLLVQIVRLTKSIQLRPIGRERAPSAQFMAGKQGSSSFINKVGLAWWYSGDTFHAIDSVTTLLIQESQEFRDSDTESVSEVITKTLQEICVDRNVFNVNNLFLAKKDTLFECREKSVTEFAEFVLKSFEDNLRLVICKRCTLYTVPRFIATSLRLEDDSLHVIAKSDQIAWQALVDKGYEFDGWTPWHPVLGMSDSQTFVPPDNFQCILAAEEHGTQNGARFSSILRFRKILTVLFCIASERSTYPLHKAMTRPFEFCMQFPHKSASNCEIIRSDCEPLIPYFVADIPIGPTETAAALAWYEACAACDEASQQRIEKGTHFLNRAINSDDIEAYVNYFVTLDALFGRRGTVEKSILAGIQSLGSNSKFEEKASWLFDLRNELVHGGSRYITEWPKYARYTQHFRTKPFADIQALAQLAVLKAPHVLKA